METKYKKLIKMLNENNLTKVEFEEKGKRYLVERNFNQSPTNLLTPASASLVSPSTSKKQIEGVFVTAPIIGTFYEAATPGKKAFVKLGDKVKKGQTLFILEAMKVMNEVKSPCNGVIKEIRYKDSDLVEFDEIIMIIG